MNFLKRAINKFERTVYSEEKRAQIFLKRNPNKIKFECPVCNYHGPFIDMSARTGVRKHAKCLNCSSLERHRLLYLAMKELSKQHDFSTMSFLHFAPEEFFRSQFKSWFATYETADLFMGNVDHKVDVCDLPFQDNSYDFLCASHVLEHIEDDELAIEEFYRVLKPGGIAILPVPIVSDRTVEYPEANPLEHDHWRAPGADYFDKYRTFFDSVTEYASTSFPAENQVFVYEDRTIWPTKEMPLRPSMKGDKHIDLIPVCFKKSLVEDESSIPLKVR